LEYWRDGRQYRESAKSAVWDDADRLLKRRQGELVTGKFTGLGPERIKVNQLLDNLIEDYVLHERKSTYDVKHRLDRNVRPALGDLRAAEVTQAHVKRYLQARRRAGAANATINRELAFLGRAFRLGHDGGMVARLLPRVEHLPEHNVREGFLEWEQYVLLRDALPSYLKLLFVVGYHIGCRQGELLLVQRREIDWREKVIRFPRRNTKNLAGKVAPLYGDMVPWIEMALSEIEQTWPACQRLFHADGKPLTFRRKAWASACVRAGVPGLLFHDLRRSAVRNMVRAGIPEKVAMAISGHKTRSMFDRYNIVSERDIRDAGAKLERYRDGLDPHNLPHSEAAPETTGASKWLN